MLILFLKAIKTNSTNQGELFNQLDPVKGYVRKDGTPVAPHQAHHQHAIPRRSLHGTQPDIPHLVQAARAKNQGNKEWLEYAKVTKRTAERIQHLISINVSDYVHQLDEAGIRHILKEHGNPASEIPRGQIPIQNDDFKRLTDVVNTWDELTTGNPTPNGIPTLVYRKQFADGETWFVEETRSGRKKLAARTLWKLKGTAAPRATPESGGVAHTPETFGGRSKNILPPPAPEDKAAKEPWQIPKTHKAFPRRCILFLKASA